MYGATQLSADSRRVAIKVLSSADPTIRARFRSEARVIAKIGHPNIITIYDYGELRDGRRFLVMEYLTGEPLDRFLESKGQLPLDLVIVLGNNALTRSFRSSTALP